MQFKRRQVEDFLEEKVVWQSAKLMCWHVILCTSEWIERFNRVLRDFIQLAILDGRPLHSAVIEYLGVYRCTPHGTTRVSTAALRHGRQPRTRLDIIGRPFKDFFERPEAEMKSLRKRVEDRQWKSKAYTDEKRGAKTPKCKEGDFVRVREPPGGREGDLRCTAPLKVLKRRGPGTFLLEDGRSWNASKL
ncbi:unnamed protein product, partial [Ixodes hexagonus]